MESLSLFQAFQEEYNKTKIELQETERSLDTFSDFCGWNSHAFKSFSQVCNKKFDIFSSGPPVKKDAFKKPELVKISTSEEGSSDECKFSPKILQSAVISKIKNTSRKDVIKQNANPTVESRNRRMLGMLQGTLRKFQDEAEKRKSQDLKRVKIENKVNAAAEEEREIISQKRKLLFDKKEKLQQLRCLEEMMDLTENYEVWECNQKFLLSFIVTKSEPQIYFLPVSHTSKSKKQLEKSKMKRLEMMQLRKTQLTEELAKIKESYKFHDCLYKEQYGPLMKQSCDKEKTDSELPSAMKYTVVDDEEKYSVMSLSLQSNTTD